MKETRKLPLAFPVETLNPKQEEQTGATDVCSQSLIRDDPLRGEVGSRLSEMIHFGKADVTCKVADLPIANFHQRRSNLMVATGPLSIFIKDDPAP